jgi:WD40 repeat protein
MTTRQKQNPYPGPYSFRKEDAAFFFGREREARHLTALAISQQLVLFYAQSGAGKTSLVNARVIPDLETRGFHVFPPARAGADLPPGIEPQNVFVYNTLKAVWGKQRPGSRFRDFFDEVSAREIAQGSPRVLVLDQFEELVTKYPEHSQHRTDFFVQLREALEADSALSVLMVMREDHIARLHPFASLLSGIRNRFYMERLRVAEATKAIRKPAEMAGRPFAPGVAEALANDLSQLHIAEQERTVSGEFVEPVQLQIVCWQLWENLRDRPGKEITSDDVRKVGNIDQALESFYERAVERAAKVPGASKTKLRQFCGAILITPGRIRNQVSRGSKVTGDLPNKAVEELVEAHLIRPEQARGGTWYELAHDRLIAPILNSNQRWKPGTSQLSQDAFAWQNNKRDPSFLYWGVQLERALRAKNEVPVGDLEEEFLAAAQREGLRRQRHNIWKLGAALALLAISFIFVAKFALEASRESDISHSRELALAAISNARSHPQLSLSLALEALARARTPEAEIALHQALTDSVVERGWSIATHTRGTGLITMSSQGKRLALVNSGGRVQVRDTATGMIVFRAPEPRSDLTALALDNQGTRLAVGSETGTVTLFDLRRSDVPRRFEAGFAIRALAFSPAADLLAVAGDSAVSTLWNAQALRLVSTLPAARPRRVGDLASSVEGNLDVAFSADGKVVATAGDDEAAYLWDSSTGTLIHRLVVGKRITAIAFGPPHLLAIATDDPVAKIWNLDSKAPPRVLFGHRDSVRDVAFSSDGKYVATASIDGTARLWRSDMGQEIRTIDLDGDVRRVAFGGPGELATAHYESTGKRRGRATTWKLHLPDVLTLSDHASVIEAVVFSPAGALLASADSGGRVVLSAHDGQPVSSFLDPSGKLEDATFVNENLLATAGSDGQVRLWQLPTGKPVGSMRRNTVEVIALAVTTRGKRLAAAAIDGTVTIWDVVSRRPITTLQAGKTPTPDVAFSPDGRLLATSGASSVRLWDATTGARVRSLGKHPFAFYRLAFDPAGRRLAAASVDGTAIVWAIQTGKELLTLHAGDASLTSVAFSPDGNRIATGCVDSTATLWDARDGRQLFTLLGHTASISRLAFSPDGSLLATGSADRTIRLEPLALEALVHIAEQRVTRGLTKRERQIYLHE